MTCIVGLAVNGKVVIGGDSAGVQGFDIRVRADSKVFKVGPFLMGFTSSFRMGQLLRYKLVVPEQPEGMADHEYLATRLVDAVRECLKAGGYASKENETETGGTFIVGYRGKVYVVENDYQVAADAAGFMAVGCGEQVARGALFASEGMLDPVERVRMALAAAEQFSAGVRGPFVVMEA